MEYEFDGHEYQLTKLGLGDARECLLRIFKLELVSESGINLSGFAQNLSTKDLDFFEEKLFGAHLHFRNESGNWVPLSKALIASHFAGRLGAYFHMLTKAIVYNYSDFLKELQIDALLGEAQAG